MYIVKHIFAIYPLHIYMSVKIKTCIRNILINIRVEVVNRKNKKELSFV